MVLATLLSGCNIEGQLNQPPTCKITSPTNNQQIMQGKNVNITVDANDPDGSITEVRFYIDNAGKGSSTSFPYNYNWNTSNENIGTHKIKATCFDNSGNSTSNEVNVSIEQESSIPVAAFTATPTSGTAPLTVSFTDQSTNNPTSWQWNFGDGETSTQQNPTHTYHNTDTYTISLTTTNSVGSNTKTQNNLIVVNSGGSAPIANFTASPTSGTAPLTVTFTDQSSNSPTIWQWDFGDSGTSTEQNPSHIYNNNGTYTVTLSVTNNYGNDTKNYTDYIYVNSSISGQPCPGTPTVTDADGNIYNTVQIGNQCWMKENLKVGMRINGSQEMSNNGIIEKYCYDDNPSNCDVYGGLYQWREMMQYTTSEGTKGICPDGWHIPMDNEWYSLVNYLGGVSPAYFALIVGGSSGFETLMAGYYTPFGNQFANINEFASFWTSTENDNSYSWNYSLFDLTWVEKVVSRASDGYKKEGRSVRCLKN